MQMTGEDLLIRHDADPTRQGNNETVDAYYKTDYFQFVISTVIRNSQFYSKHQQFHC